MKIEASNTTVEPLKPEGLPSETFTENGKLTFGKEKVEYKSGGWIGGMASALDKLLKVGDAQTKIIPGHGPLSTKDDMRASRDMLHLVNDRLGVFSKKNASLDDVLKANPVMGMEPKWGQGFLNGERFLRMACPSIAKHAQLVKSGSARSISW